MQKRKDSSHYQNVLLLSFKKIKNKNVGICGFWIVAAQVLFVIFYTFLQFLKHENQVIIFADISPVFVIGLLLSISSSSSWSFFKVDS